MVYLFRWYSLLIRWGGGWGSGHPDPEIGGVIYKKDFFGPSGLSLV